MSEQQRIAELEARCAELSARLAWFESDSAFAELLHECKELRQRVANGESGAESEDARQTALAAYQAGCARAHNDTVEGSYSPGLADDPEAAGEWLEEYCAALESQRAS